MKRSSFTTGQLATLFDVSPRKVTSWCASGLLPHWRLPGGADRRIDYADAMRFATAHGIKPALRALHAMRTLYTIGCPVDMCDSLSQALPGWSVDSIDRDRSLYALPPCAGIVIGPEIGTTLAIALGHVCEQSYPGTARIRVHSPHDDVDGRGVFTLEIPLCGEATVTLIAKGMSV